MVDRKELRLFGYIGIAEKFEEFRKVPCKLALLCGNVTAADLRYYHT
jgi:hypothetical protein